MPFTAYKSIPDVIKEYKVFFAQDNFMVSKLMEIREFFRDVFSECALALSQNQENLEQL